MSNEKLVLVLGGTGYVGRNIVSTLLQEISGLRVVVGARKYAQVPAGADFRCVDATAMASLEEALTGVTHVINCVMGDADTMIVVARNIAAVGFRCGLRTLVHLSSTAVYGSLSGNLDESAEVGCGTDWYGTAKLESERIISSIRDTGPSAVILRPALIYGPGSSQWTLRIARLLVAHRLGDLTVHGEGLCNLVHVQDVARAATNALFLPEAEGRTFNIAAPNPVTWNRYLTDLGDALGVKRHFIPGWKLTLESKLLVYPLKVMEVLMQKLGLRRLAPAALTPNLVRLFERRVRYQSVAANVLLPAGWVPYDTGIRQSVAWLDSVLPGRFQ